MQHKGEIVERVVRESGHSITKLAKKMGKSRKWVYLMFDNPNVPIDYIVEIGKIIHHDFSEDIKDLKVYKINPVVAYAEEPIGFDTQKEEIEFWKNKYLFLLEKYNKLLLREED